MENDLIISRMTYLSVTKSNSEKMQELIKEMLNIGGINKLHAEELLSGKEMYEPASITKEKKVYSPPKVTIYSQ